MSRLFLGQRELNLVSDLTKELTRDVVGQVIYYYSINETLTRNHELYNEATDGKVFDPPVQLPALVGTPDRSVKTSVFGPERLAKLEAFLQNRDLDDVGVSVSTGDFVRYGDTLYEITNITNMTNVFGMVEQNVGVKLDLTQARKGQFDAPQVGPSDRRFSDPDAVQKTFEQSRGAETVGGAETGDRRELQENGTLEQPLTGPARVVEDSTHGSDFYAEKW